jgi:Cupin-like domain
MVDPLAPDLVRFPRFEEAMKHALVAELEPGDALFIPSLWWHNVQAHDTLNVLLNYWWGIDDEAAPFPAMIHALLSIRDLPPAERETWKAWFDHYIFGKEAIGVADHLPPHARGVLGAPSAQRTQLMRDYLVRALSRR